MIIIISRCSNLIDLQTDLQAVLILSVKDIILGFKCNHFLMNKMIGTKGVLDSYGISGKAETPQACRGH